MMRKLKIDLLTVSRDSGVPTVQLVVGRQIIPITIPKNIADAAEQTDQPISLADSLIPDAWLYRGYVARVQHAEGTAANELLIRIKHAILSKEREFDKLKRQVEAFENFEQIAKNRREPIPDNVKMYVWQRDDGRCVRCGSQDRLEYDHIIPLSKGGSNTDRNIQLLCEACNRAKGAEIATG